MGAKAARVSAATMLSRVLGLIRETILAALLGATPFADVFVVAFRIPNLARDLFAEGALSAAFVPTFTDTLKNQGKERAFLLANRVIGLLLVIVGALTLLGIAFAPQLVALVTEFQGDKAFDLSPADMNSLAASATRLLFPFLPIVSLAAIVMGQLNAQERFTAPSLAPATFNTVAIVCGVILVRAEPGHEVALYGWSGGMLLGGLAQLLVQIPSLRKTGFRFRPRIDTRDPGVRRIGFLMTPAVIGLAATNVNIMVNTFFATQESGAAAWLGYAFRVIWLPIGVFAVAIATISTTRLALRAAENDTSGVGRTLAEGLRLIAFLAVPSMLGLMVLGKPIVRLIFERGAFGAGDTEAVTIALYMYAIGLYAYSAVKVTAPAFYALDRPRAPLVASASAVAVNIAANILLFPVLGFAGLALGTALGALVNFAVLVLAFREVTGRFDVAPLARHLLRVTIAAAPAVAVAWLTTASLEGLLGTASTGLRAAAVFPGILASVVVYVALSRLLRLRELDDLVSLLRRRAR